ncbi:MAG: O-antigen ligase family protein [bacterium]
MKEPLVHNQPFAVRYDWLYWTLTLGVALLFLALLWITGNIMYVLAGFAALLALGVSGKPHIRLFVLIGLMPLAHAGFGTASFGGFGLFDIYAAVFIFFFLWRIVILQGMEIGKIPVLPLSLLMLAAFIPSIINSSALLESLKALVQLFGSILISAGVYYYLRTYYSSSFLLALIKTFVIVAMLVSLYGIFETYASRSIFQVLVGRAYFSLFQDVNYYASYLLMALALGGGLLFLVVRRAERLFLIGGALVLVVTIIATVSRSALLVLLLLVIGFVAFVFQYQQGSRKFIGPMILITFLSLISLLLFTDAGGKMIDLFTLSRRVESVVSGKDASLDQRMTIFDVTQRMIESHPVLGVGFGAFEKTFNSYQGSNLSTGFGRSAHNTALRILAETGILGMVPALLFVGFLIWYMVVAVQKARRSEEKTLIFSLSISLGSFLFMSLTLDQMFEPHFWIGLGITLVVAERLHHGETVLTQKEV